MKDAKQTSDRPKDGLTPKDPTAQAQGSEEQELRCERCGGYDLLGLGSIDYPTGVVADDGSEAQEWTNGEFVRCRECGLVFTP